MEHSAFEILKDESGPLFVACQAAIAEEERRYFEQNPQVSYHRICAPASAREVGFKVEVFANEHPPPHFRVKYRDLTANFSIATCERLNGVLPLRERDVRKWWLQHRMAIVSAWNDHRPADCTVGPIDVQALGWIN